MAIDSFDKVGAGGQYPREFFKALTPGMTTGRPQSLFYLAGIPGAAVESSAGMSGEALTTYSGQIPYTNAVSGETNLCRLVSQSVTGGQLLVCDRLWHNSGIDVTSTGSQTINSAAFPARDVNGSSNGVEVYVGVEVTTATGAGTPTITLGYTNQSGTAGKTATNILATGASSVIGSFYPIGVQSGDNGVRSIQTYQQSASWTSGAVSLVAYRVVARIEHPGDNYAHAIDWVTMGGPALYDNSVLFFVFIPRSATASTLNGHIVWTQG